MRTRSFAGREILLIAAGLVIGYTSLCVAGSEMEGSGAEHVATPPKESNAIAKPAKSAYPKGFVVEGPLPDGFPLPSEVGKIVEKTYPLCRTYSAAGNQAFSKCFLYLVLHKHEMTAPVIMDYKHRDPETKSKSRRELDFLDVQRMHFVLEKPSLDKPRREGFVEVADIPRLRMLSIAYQGQLSTEKLKRAEESLAAEIGRRPGLVAVGPPRVLGYNSPMVPKDQTYWEIQVPVGSKPTEGAKPPKV